jgi:hypothetical protein
MANALTDIDWIYCFARGSKFVFLNRWDDDIKEFDTYKEAADFANSNRDLINKRIKNDNRNSKNIRKKAA